MFVMYLRRKKKLWYSLLRSNLRPWKPWFGCHIDFVIHVGILAIAILLTWLFTKPFQCGVQTQKIQPCSPIHARVHKRPPRGFQATSTTDDVVRTQPASLSTFGLDHTCRRITIPIPVARSIAGPAGTRRPIVNGIHPAGFIGAVRTGIWKVTDDLCLWKASIQVGIEKFKSRSEVFVCQFAVFFFSQLDTLFINLDVRKIPPVFPVATIVCPVAYQLRVFVYNPFFVDWALRLGNLFCIFLTLLFPFCDDVQG